MSDVRVLLDYLSPQWLPPEIKAVYRRLRAHDEARDRKGFVECPECGAMKDDSAYPTCAKLSCIHAHRERLAPESAPSQA